MATETIKVTIEDIREACFRRDAADYKEMCECPIAQAVRKLHPDWSVAASFIDRGRYGSIRLPFEAKEFIRRFDNAAPVEPFELKLKWPTSPAGTCAG